MPGLQELWKYKKKQEKKCLRLDALEKAAAPDTAASVKPSSGRAQLLEMEPIRSQSRGQFGVA